MGRPTVIRHIHLGVQSVSPPCPLDSPLHSPVTRATAARQRRNRGGDGGVTEVTAMGGSKRGWNARTQTRNERGQFAVAVTEMKTSARTLILVDSDSDTNFEGGPTATEMKGSQGAPSATQKTRSAAGKKITEGASSTAEKRGSAAGKKNTNGAPAATEKRGSAAGKKGSPKKPIGGAASASMKKKGSASRKKAIDGGVSVSAEKKKVCEIPPHSHSLHEIESDQ